MSIAYSGSAHYSTFLPLTRQDIINGVEIALLAAGWTTISGHGTSSLIMQSSTTPQGYATRIKVTDSGSLCVLFSLGSSDGSIVLGNSFTGGTTIGCPLALFTGAMYAVACCAYQAFIYVVPNNAIQGNFVGFGVPYVPSFLTSITTRLGWMCSNGNNASVNTGGVSPSFRTKPHNGGNGATQTITNSLSWTVQFASSVGAVTLATMVGTMWTYAQAYRWTTNQAFFYDPIIGWGDTGYTVAGRFRGQLWDAVISTDPLAGDTALTFDSHTWTVITDGNLPTDYMRGTLLVATS